MGFWVGGDVFRLTVKADGAWDEVLGGLGVLAQGEGGRGLQCVFGWVRRCFSSV
jgi:hypothetical protein